MNLPNKLTISRIIITAAFIFFVLSAGLAAKVWALAAFLLASLTDLLDGFIAKRNNQVTDFGKLMDPIADKILTLSAFLAFVELNIVPAWMVIAIIFREVLITALRGLALAKGKVIAADDGGKHKTVSQVVAIVAILVFLILREGGSAVFSFWNSRAETIAGEIILVLMMIAVFFTLVSGTAYLIKNRGVYTNAKTD